MAPRWCNTNLMHMQFRLKNSTQKVLEANVIYACLYRALLKQQNKRKIVQRSAKNCLQQNMPQTYWELDSDDVTPTLSKVKLARWQIHWQWEIHAQCVTDWCICSGWYTFFPVCPVDVKTFSGHPVEAATGHICQKLVRVFMVKLVQKMQLLEVQVQV